MNDIPKNRIEIKALVGIYFLFKDEELVYIGQSTNINKRVHDHIIDKKFNTYTYIQFPKFKLDEMEKKFIRIYSPKYNIIHKGKIFISETITNLTNNTPNTILIHEGKAIIKL